MKTRSQQVKHLNHHHASDDTSVDTSPSSKGKLTNYNCSCDCYLFTCIQLITKRRRNLRKCFIVFNSVTWYFVTLWNNSFERQLRQKILRELFSSEDFINGSNALSEILSGPLTSLVYRSCQTSLHGQISRTQEKIGFHCCIFKSTNNVKHDHKMDR